MTITEYWIECVETAADECGANLTPEQAKFIAEAVESGHNNYGMAFYAPPSSDRIAVIQRECDDKVRAARTETERIRSDFVKNICIRRHCNPSDVVLEGGGHAKIL